MLVLNCFVTLLWQHIFYNLENVVRILEPQKGVNNKECWNLNVDTKVIEKQFLIILCCPCHCLRINLKILLFEAQLPIHWQVGPLDLIVVQLELHYLLFIQNSRFIFLLFGDRALAFTFRALRRPLCILFVL